jgi:hypothetical protein
VLQRLYVIDHVTSAWPFRRAGCWAMKNPRTRHSCRRLADLQRPAKNAKPPPPPHSLEEASDVSPARSRERYRRNRHFPSIIPKRGIGRGFHLLIHTGVEWGCRICLAEERPTSFTISPSSPRKQQWRDAPMARCNEPLTAPGARRGFAENKRFVRAVSGEPHPHGDAHRRRQPHECHPHSGCAPACHRSSCPRDRLRIRRTGRSRCRLCLAASAFRMRKYCSSSIACWC